MKQLILIIILIASSNIHYGQILNEEFDNWLLIDTLGQAYEDLTGWETNNGNLGNGFATTPNIKLVENNDTGVSLTTNEQGIDGLLSGKIHQTIFTDNLISLSYLSKCDSIYERGACVVNIYNTSNEMVYTDSIHQVEPNYTLKTIELEQVNLENSAELTIEFIAFGQLGEFEEFQAYSEFNLLNVNSNYISSNSNNTLASTVEVYPNPFKDLINIKTKDNGFVDYILFNSNGILLQKGFGNTLQISNLTNGLYFLEIKTKNAVQVEQIIKI